MSDLLGWVRANETHSELAGCVLFEESLVCRVHAEMALPETRQRVRLMQACFRKFDDFLPCGPGAERLENDQILEQIERLSGLGQLSLCLRRMSASAPSTAESGRRHLHNLRARQAAAMSWRVDAEAALLSLAKKLNARGRSITRWQDALVASLLLPKSSEPDLPSLVAAGTCIDRPASELVVSGLWAPTAFVNWQGTSDE